MLWKTTVTLLIFPTVSLAEGIMRIGDLGPDQHHNIFKTTKVKQGASESLNMCY